MLLNYCVLKKIEMQNLKTIKKNDKIANSIIISLSTIVLALVIAMRKFKIPVEFNFDTHLFAGINAFLNSIVAILLVIGLVSIKQRKYKLHKQLMLAAVGCSVLFLLFYVLYHFTTIETSYLGNYKVVYFILLITHIILAGTSLPFILYSVYRGLTGEYAKHKKLTKFVWPIWFYVAVSGVIVYFMISPYY